MEEWAGSDLGLSELKVSAAPSCACRSDQATPPGEKHTRFTETRIA